MQTLQQDPKSDVQPILRSFEAAFRSWRYTSVTSVGEELFHSLTLADRPILEDAEASYERVVAALINEKQQNEFVGGEASLDICVPTDLGIGDQDNAAHSGYDVTPSPLEIISKCFMSIDACVNRSKQTLTQSLFFEDESLYIEAVEHAQALLHQFIHGKGIDDPVAAHLAQPRETGSQEDPPRVKLAPLSFAMSPEEFKLLGQYERGDLAENDIAPAVLARMNELTAAVNRFDEVGRRLLASASDVGKQSSPLRCTVTTFTRLFLQAAMLYVYAAHKMATASESIAVVRTAASRGDSTDAGAQLQGQAEGENLTGEESIEQLVERISRLFELDEQAVTFLTEHMTRHSTNLVDNTEIVNTTGPCKALMAGTALLLQYVIVSLRMEREPGTNATPMDILAEILEMPLVNSIFMVDKNEGRFDEHENGSCQQGHLHKSACQAWASWARSAESSSVLAVTGTSIVFLALGLVSELQVNSIRTAQASLNSLARICSECPTESPVSDFVNDEFQRAMLLAADQGNAAIPCSSVFVSRASDASVHPVLRERLKTLLTATPLPPHLRFLFHGWQQLGENSTVSVADLKKSIDAGDLTKKAKPTVKEVLTKSGDWMLRLTARRTALVQFGSPSLTMKVVSILRLATYANPSIEHDQHFIWPRAAVPNYGPLSPIFDRADGLFGAFHSSAPNSGMQPHPINSVDWSQRESDRLLPAKISLKFRPRGEPVCDPPVVQQEVARNVAPGSSSPMLSPIAPPGQLAQLANVGEDPAESVETKFVSAETSFSILDKLQPRVFEYSDAMGWVEKQLLPSTTVKSLIPNYAGDSIRSANCSQYAMLFPTLPTAAQRTRLEALTRGISKSFGPVSVVNSHDFPHVRECEASENSEDQQSCNVGAPGQGKRYNSLSSLLSELDVYGIGFRVHAKLPLPPASLEALALACAPANPHRELESPGKSRKLSAVIRLDRSPFFPCYAQVLGHILSSVSHRNIVVTHANELRQQRSDYLHVLPSTAPESSTTSIDGEGRESNANSSVSSRRGSISGGALMLVATTADGKPPLLRPRSGSIISTSSDISATLRARMRETRASLVPAPPPSQHAITLDGRKLAGQLLFSLSHVLGHSLFVNDVETCAAGGAMSADIVMAVYQQLNLPLLLLHLLVQPMVAAMLTPPLLALPLPAYSAGENLPPSSDSNQRPRSLTQESGLSLKSDVPSGSTVGILPAAFSSFPQIFRVYAIAQASALTRCTALVGAAAGFYASVSASSALSPSKYGSESNSAGASSVSPDVNANNDEAFRGFLLEASSPLGFSSPLCQNRSRATVTLFRLLERVVRDSPLHQLLLVRAGAYTLLSPTLMSREIPRPLAQIPDNAQDLLRVLNPAAKNTHNVEKAACSLFGRTFTDFITAVATPTSRVHLANLPMSVQIPMPRLGSSNPLGAQSSGSNPQTLASLVQKIANHPWVSMHTLLSLPELGFNTYIGRPLARLARMILRAQCALPKALRETVIGGGGSKAAAERSTRVLESLRAALGDTTIRKVADAYREAALAMALAQFRAREVSGDAEITADAIRQAYVTLFHANTQSQTEPTNPDADTAFNYSYSHYQRAASGAADVAGIQAVLQKIDEVFTHGRSASSQQGGSSEGAESRGEASEGGNRSHAPSTPNLGEDSTPSVSAVVAQRGVPGSNRLAALHQRNRSFGLGIPGSNALNATAASGGPGAAGLLDQMGDDPEGRNGEVKPPGGSLSLAKSRLMQKNLRMRLYSWKGGVGANGNNNQDDMTGTGRGNSTGPMDDNEVETQFKRWTSQLPASIHDDIIRSVHAPNHQLEPFNYVYFEDNACDDFDDFSGPSVEHRMGPVGEELRCYRALADDWACAASATELNEASPEYITQVLTLQATRLAAAAQTAKLHTLPSFSSTASALSSLAAPLIQEASQPSTRLVSCASSAHSAQIPDVASEADLEAEWQSLFKAIISDDQPNHERVQEQEE